MVAAGGCGNAPGPARPDEQAAAGGTLTEEPEEPPIIPPGTGGSPDEGPDEEGPGGTPDGDTGTDRAGGPPAAELTAEIFVIGVGSGDHVITEFSGNEIIDLRAFTTITDFPDLPLIQGTAAVTVDLTGHGGGQVVIEGADIDRLGPQHFLFYGWTYGTDGDDELAGTKGGDAIDGGRGSDEIDGYGGNDHLRGGAGKDHLDGWSGNDTLDGGPGNDTLEGGPGNDRLDGGPGNDTLEGSVGNYTLEVNDGNDLLEGGPGNDRLDGGAGDDLLFGGEGDDTLIGGPGADTLDGGAGDDLLIGIGPRRWIRDKWYTYGGAPAVETYVFAPGHGNDVIAWFDHDENDDDRIDLSAFSAIASFDGLVILDNEDGAVIDLTQYGGGTVRLDDVGAERLDADDFIFS